MSGNVKLLTPSSGSVTITTGDTASNLTVTVPAATDTLVNLSSSQTLSNKTLSNPAFTGSPSGGTFTSTTITAANGNTVEATSGPTSTQLAGQRNKIINGAMMIDQRNAGAAVTVTSGYTLDRWFSDKVSDGSFTIQRSTTAPAGFINSLLVTVTSADTSLSASQRCRFVQQIEGFNTSDLAWGTASAKSVTLSFWVRASITGTFSGTLVNSAENRSYPFAYSISAANTFEYKTITITGDTTGTWLTDNGTGIRLTFSLGVGSNFLGTAGAWASTVLLGATGETPLIGTSGATFYITGVQLEKGATATPFENRLYGTELALCQRYYWKNLSTNATAALGGVGAFGSATIAYLMFQYPVPMRSAPTASYANAYIANGTNGWAVTSFGSAYIGPNAAQIQTVASAATATGGQAAYIYDAGSGIGYVAFSAEL